MCLTKDRVLMTDPRQIRDVLYPGCIADVMVTAFYYPVDGDLKRTQGGRGVSWTVDAVVKRADARRLDGRATVNDLPPPSVTDEQEIFADYGLEPEAPTDLGLSDDEPF
jgi:pantoate kinase